MAGIRLKGTTTTQYVENVEVISRTKGGVKSIQIWTFKPVNDGTQVAVDIEYTIPIPVIGKLAEKIVVMMNEHEGDIVMANLKSRMEA